MASTPDSYEQIRQAFRWNVPDRFNIAVAACDRHAGPDNRTALLSLDQRGTVTEFGFRDLMRLSSRFANVLTGLGAKAGDRIAVLLPQCPETAIAHLAAYRMGAIAVPLFTQFGPDALSYRLGDSGARFLVTDAASAEKVDSIRHDLPALEHVIRIGSEWDRLLESASDRHVPVDSAGDDPCLIIYTSGTTGPPKGALHAHRVLPGHVPGMDFLHEFFPRPGDRFWTPADWAWIGALYDVLFPAWYHGVPVVAFRAQRFDPEEAFAIMGRLGVRNAFMPPTALKLMRQVSDPRRHFPRGLRTCFSGGEPLGAELLDWGRDALGCTINEGYGQTECNLVVANCASLFPPRPGSMGRAAPGHDVAVIDDDGNEVTPGTIGDIAVRRPDPVMMLEYWRNPEATARKYRGKWLLTGDQGRRDADGHFWFVGRDDDVITSAGYRIGPGEIEDCLLRHPAVQLAAVIGVPDATRTEIVKAFVVPRPGIAADDGVAESIRDHVRARLAPYECPRLIEFVPALPLTATGKIRRGELRRMSSKSDNGTATGDGDRS